MPCFSLSLSIYVQSIYTVYIDICVCVCVMWFFMNRLSSAFCNIGNCGYKCLCVSCVTPLFYWKWVSLSQEEWRHLLRWSHRTQAVTHKLLSLRRFCSQLNLADAWGVALHASLLSFAVTGSSILGNRPVGMEGEGTYKHSPSRQTLVEGITIATA